MKKKKNIFGLISGFALLLSVTVFTSCKDDSKKEEEGDSKDLADKFNAAKFKDSKEAEFMVEAAAFMLQVKEMAKMANEKGKQSSVKEMATMMSKDHETVEKEMKDIAGRKQITLPAELTEKGQHEVKKLNEGSGEEFDKKFCEIMVEQHKDAIKNFEKGREKSEDVEIKNWAIRTLPILRNHLDHAMTCDQNFKGDGKDVKKEVYNANKKQQEEGLQQNDKTEGGKSPVKDRDQSDKDKEKKAGKEQK